MKLPSLPKIALLTLALGFAGSLGVRADDTATPPTPPAGDHPHHHDGVLTPDQQAELKKDRDQVFASDPALKQEGEDLRTQHASMKDGSDTDKKAFHEKMRAFQEKVDAAVEKIDPNAAPLIAKLKAAHHGHRGGGAGAAPAPSDSNQ